MIMMMAATVGYRRGGEGCGAGDDGSNDDCMFNWRCNSITFSSGEIEV